MNHCLLEVDVLEAPQIRYTQDNQTPVAEMLVQVDGLRPDDPPGRLKVVGWGNLAQDLQNRVRPGQRLVLEGRLRMSMVTRNDGMKEKRAEFTLARVHQVGGSGGSVAAAAPPPTPFATGAAAPNRPSAAPPAPAQQAPTPTWNASPLVPDSLEGEDDIPF